MGDGDAAVITAVTNLGTTLGSEIRELSSSVGELRVAVNGAQKDVKNQGREIGELKREQSGMREKVEGIPTAILSTIREHKADCEKERDKLADATGAVNMPTAAERASMGTGNGDRALGSLFRKLLPYIIAIIASLVAGGGAVKIVFDDDATPEVQKQHVRQIDRP